MLKVLTKKEIRKQNLDLMQWVKHALEGEHGTYIFNLLTTLKQLTEAREREAQWKAKREAKNHGTEQ